MARRGLVARLVLLAFGAAWLCTWAGTRVCSMDDSYTRAIDNAVSPATPSEAALVRHLLETSMWNWKSRSDYSAARELVKNISGTPTSMVRLEIGNANRGSYEVLWLVKTVKVVWLITNMRGRTERITMPPTSWERLSTQLQAANLESLGSAADTAVDDGSTYFFAFCDQARAIEFAVYGLPLGKEVAPGQRGFAPRVATQSTLVTALLDIMRGLSSGPDESGRSSSHDPPSRMQ
jgi:hypothetical protein